MSVDEFLQLLSYVLFVLIFIVTLARAIRAPLRTNIDIVLFFGAATGVVSIAWVRQAFDLSAPLLADISAVFLMLLPYLLLRLVDDFDGVPRALMRAAEIGLALSIVAIFFFLELPSWTTLLLVIYFVLLTVYISSRFATAARRAGGVTRRRLQTVAFGSFALGLVLAIVGFQIALPHLAPVWTVLSRVVSVAAGLGYFLGFAPPAWLRRAWQEPELRAFLGRAARLPRLPNTTAIVRELERGTARSVGAPAATIGLWDEAAGFLLFDSVSLGAIFEVRPGQFIAGRVFASQRAAFVPDAIAADPDNADVYRSTGAIAVLAAPITAGERRLGVLVVYASRPPIFADDDLVLVQLLADQAAVILESRALIDEAARVRAREETLRMKDDFLSAAAHDLKTPLTTLVALTQLMERRALRDSQAPADLSNIRRLKSEAERLTRLVMELLDASRAEQGQLLGPRQPTDLAALAREICERLTTARHRCVVTGDESVVGAFDQVRVMQLVENLIENAIKYSPAGGEVRTRVWREGDQAHLTVTDQGIGIPASDLPHIFERFHRGANVDDRRFAGMGLGLFICQGIAAQHGGSMEVRSPGPGQGSTFHVILPLAERESVPARVMEGNAHAG